MKIKLISFAIILICLTCALFAGVLSLQRSRGVVITPEEKVKIEAILERFDIIPPAYFTKS